MTCDGCQQAVSVRDARVCWCQQTLYLQCVQNHVLKCGHRPGEKPGKELEKMSSEGEKPEEVGKGFTQGKAIGSLVRKVLQNIQKEKDKKK